MNELSGVERTDYDQHLYARDDHARLAHDRLKGCLAWSLFLALVVLPVAMLFGWFSDAFVDAPWAHSVLGRPTMVGTWVGEFTTPSGIRFAMYLDLERGMLEDGSYHTEEDLGAILSGRANWCDNSGRHAEGLEINGSVPILQGYDGTANGVDLGVATSDHPQVGLLPEHLEGQWKGDTLTFKPSFLFWTGDTLHWSSTNPDLTKPITVTFKRGNADGFQVACAKLEQTHP